MSFLAGAGVSEVVRSLLPKEPESVQVERLQREISERNRAIEEQRVEIRRLEGEVKDLASSSNAAYDQYQRDIAECQSGMNQPAAPDAMGATINENLLKAGVSRWEGVYARLTVMRETFKEVGTPIGHLLEVFDAAAQGRDHPRLELLRPEAWGSDIPNAENFARQVVDEIRANNKVMAIEPGIDITPIYDFLEVDVVKSPAKVIALKGCADGIRVGPGGGWASGGGIQVSSKGDKRSDAVTWEHENNHNIEDFNLFNPDRPEIRRVLNRDRVINFAETYLDAVYLTLCYWGNLSEEDAQKMKYGGPLLRFGDHEVNEYNERVGGFNLEVPQWVKDLANGDERALTELAEH